ncbi:MAG: hypothetical protein JNM43_06465 [Planctomycetaceae bacterium]|nr:hypothetical protein [Planctomycetaceae bacterium]
MRPGQLIFCFLTCFLFTDRRCIGQESSSPPPDKLQIAVEPESIDPATIVLERLAQKATVNFEGRTLKDLFRWLQNDQKLSVSINTEELKQAGILSSDKLRDSLNDEPLYLLLDRLSNIGVGWYLSGEDLCLTSLEHSSRQYNTRFYNLGELFDAGFEAHVLLEMITASVGGNWMIMGDEDGDLVLLGDVIFVRQTEPVQRELKALLQAIKTPARRTLTLDAPQHTAIRSLMAQKFSLTLDEVLLSDAVDELAKISGTKIQLNLADLKKHGTSVRTPVSAELQDQKLETILDFILSEQNLTWLIQDGVIQIVCKETAESNTRTAVYDVRDLCRNESESSALKSALYTQCGGLWIDNGDEIGSISFARPGIMVVRHTDKMQDSILNLLENYRTALRGSKPRKVAGPDPDEVLTYYYRIPTKMAEQLAAQLPGLIQPETWKDETHPDAVGTVRRLASTDELRDAHGNALVSSNGASTPGFLLVVPHDVMVITQRRKVHDEIRELLHKVQHGDMPGSGGGGLGGGGLGGGGLGGGMGGGGFGGGGFGGGLFNVAPEPSLRNSLHSVTE